MNDTDVIEVIRRIVRRELIWYRHYWGVVLSTQDRLGVGRVQVQVPDLRWNDQTTAPWCMPRYNPGISVPRQGSKVEIYFVEGNPARPVWLGRVPELGEVVKALSRPTMHVLFEDEVTGDAVTYDEQSGIFAFRGSGDNLVTYNALVSALNTWCSTGALGVHVHTGVTTGSGSSGPPASMAAPNISAAAAPHLVTGD